MSWHLEQKVTVGVIAGLILNTAAIVWWASELSKTVETFEGTPDKVAKIEGDIIRLQEHDKLMNGVLGELKQTTKKMNELILKFGNEQSRRAPIVNRAEEELFKHRHAK